MKKKKSKEVTPHNLWWCVACSSKELTHPEMMEHLREKHKLETKGLKCNKSMIMHMDGDTWFSWKYDVTIDTPSGPLSLINETLSRRSKDDWMRHC